MRPIRFIVLLALLPGLLIAAPALQIVKPIISQMDGGTPDPPGYEHVPGEVLFFTCRISGYTKSSESKIHVAFSVQPFDAQGVPLGELYKNEISDEVSPQDKEWLPKIETEIPIPPLVGSGAYKILVKVEDLVAKTSSELPVTFQVRGRDVAPSDTLVVRNFRFFRSEEDTVALEKPVYKPGDGVWAKFDITGFKYGEKNKIDVSSVIAPSGKVLWTQPEPAAERTESFYPKRYMPASMGISLQGSIRPGEYTMAVQVKDTVGNQTCEAKYTFTVE
jgi:hypothetical protein